MKSTLMIMGILLSTAALSKQPTTVKVADGSSAFCQSEKDVDSRRNAKGLYRIKATEAKIVEDNVEVTMELRFLKCEKKARGFSFQEVAPFAEKNIFKNYQGSEVQIQTEAIELKTYKDGNYKVLVAQEITKNEAVQRIKAIIPIEEVLNDPTSNRTMYDANFDVFITKLLRYQQAGSEKSFRDITPFGSYRIHMNFNLDKGTVQLR